MSFSDIKYSNAGAVVVVSLEGVEASVPFVYEGGVLSYTESHEGAVGRPERVFERKKEVIRLARTALLIDLKTVITPAWVDC
jgi:hypothetical protein